MLPPGVPEDPLALCDPADSPAEGIWPPDCSLPDWPDVPVEEGNGDELPDDPLED